MGVANLGYDHRVVIHEQGPGRGTETTNHIESFWSELRRLGVFDKGFNTNDIAKVQERVNVALWKWRNKNHWTEALFAVLQVM